MIMFMSPLPYRICRHLPMILLMLVTGLRVRLIVKLLLFTIINPLHQHLDASIQQHKRMSKGVRAYDRKQSIPTTARTFLNRSRELMCGVLP